MTRRLRDELRTGAALALAVRSPREWAEHARYILARTEDALARALGEPVRITDPLASYAPCDAAAWYDGMRVHCQGRHRHTGRHHSSGDPLPYSATLLEWEDTP